MSLKEFSDRKGVSRQAVCLAIKNKRIKARRIGKRWLVPETELAAWDENTHPSQSTVAKRIEGLPSYLESKTARAAYEAKLSQLECRKREGALLDAEEVRAAVAGMVIDFRAKILVIGDELGDRLAGMSDSIACRTLLDERLAQALEELSMWGSE